MIKTYRSGFFESRLTLAVADPVWHVDVAGEVAMGAVTQSFVADCIVAGIVLVVVCKGVRGCGFCEACGLFCVVVSSLEGFALENWLFWTMKKTRFCTCWWLKDAVLQRKCWLMTRLTGWRIDRYSGLLTHTVLHVLIDDESVLFGNAVRKCTSHNHGVDVFNLRRRVRLARPLDRISRTTHVVLTVRNGG
jgi:hypothetical protein